MARTILTSITIAAHPEHVWDALSDFNAYPQWNPFITQISGQLEKGKQLEIKLPQMTFKPTIIQLEKDKHLSWLGHLWIKGLFDGEHFFKLTDNGDGTTLFEQGEYFRGLLIPIVGKKVFHTTQDNFIAMNKALKTLVERNSLVQAKAV